MSTFQRVWKGVTIVYLSLVTRRSGITCENGHCKTKQLKTSTFGLLSGQRQPVAPCTKHF